MVGEHSTTILAGDCTVLAACQYCDSTVTGDRVQPQPRAHLGARRALETHLVRHCCRMMCGSHPHHRTKMGLHLAAAAAVPRCPHCARGARSAHLPLGITCSRNMPQQCMCRSSMCTPATLRTVLDYNTSTTTNLRAPACLSVSEYSTGPYIRAATLIGPLPIAKLGQWLGIPQQTHHI
jgi:hypothetical protein